MKSEPDTFGIADLARVRTEPWTGVRSRIARNHMRAMEVGDDVLFYHSSCTPPGVAGLARVVRTHVVDPTQFDPASPYYDPDSSHDEPTWDCVEVEHVETLPRLVPLPELRGERALRGMILFRQGRLSVQPVKEAEFRRIVELARAPAATPAAKPRPKASRKAGKRGRPARRRRAARRRRRGRASPSRRCR